MMRVVVVGASYSSFVVLLLCCVCVELCGGDRLVVVCVCVCVSVPVCMWCGVVVIDVPPACGRRGRKGEVTRKGVCFVRMRDACSPAQN